MMKKPINLGIYIQKIEFKLEINTHFVSSYYSRETSVFGIQLEQEDYGRLFYKMMNNLYIRLETPSRIQIKKDMNCGIIRNE